MTRAPVHGALTLALLVACSGKGATVRPADSPAVDTAQARPATGAVSTGAAPTRGLDTAAVLDTLRRIVQEQKLTKLAPDCYRFEPDSGALPYRFTAREVHNAKCGGDPQTAPRLFFITWDPQTGDVETDAFKAPEGATDTIRRPRKP
jgi:hypothetical protein